MCGSQKIQVDSAVCVLRHASGGGHGYRRECEGFLKCLASSQTKRPIAFQSIFLLIDAGKIIPHPEQMGIPQPIEVTKERPIGPACELCEIRASAVANAVCRSVNASAQFEPFLTPVASALT